MNQNLINLVEIQKLDNSIRALTAEIQSLPKKIAAIEEQLAEHKALVEASQKKLADNQLSRRTREKEIGSLRDKISKHKDQMLEVKTNEQYRALTHEIEFHEAEIRKLEDKILAEMIESESLERQVREAQQSLGAEQSRAKEEIRQAEDRKRQQEEKLRAEEELRQKAQSQIEPDIYFSYQRIYGFRKGTAVAAVFNGACGACHVALRPQAFNDVLTNERILHCESCGCILYYVPKPPAESATS